ncbi:MAG: hypothetical protein S4CHLAM6_05550 [Chlamydiae bacterium]|nr:hypothetical protein [Chlamydiota bacterium]
MSFALDRLYCGRGGTVDFLASDGLQKEADRAKTTETKIDSAVEVILGATATSETEKEVKSGSSWISAREDRYIVTLRQLSTFSFEGKSIEDLIKEVTHPGLKTALGILEKVSKKHISSFDVRTNYFEKFIKALRSAIDSEMGENSLDFKVATQLCSKLFTVDIKDTSIGTRFIDDLLGNYQPSSIQELDATMLELNLRAGLSGKTWSHRSTDISRKLTANIPFASWDPALYSTRSRITDVRIDSRDVEFIRTACPVIGSNFSPRIDPLFIGMLRDLKAQGKQYLYINNQSADLASDSRPGQSLCESNRVAAIRALSKEDEFKDMFHVVSFAHDSTFYKAAAAVEAEELKAEFFSYLKDGEQGYFLPDHLKNSEENLAEIQELINVIHAQYFEGKPKLSRDERQEFLHVAYAEISKFIISKMGIDAVNITCKDGVDRAAGSFANLVKVAQPDVDFKLLLWGLSFPAVLNHARPPKGHRHVVSIATLKRIDKVQESRES